MELSSDNNTIWMNTCLKKAQNIINKYHLDKSHFFSISKFVLFVQDDVKNMYGYIAGAKPYYMIGINQSLVKETRENKRMITIILVHELLHAIHDSWEHDKIYKTEQMLAKKARYDDALKNIEKLYLGGKIKPCYK